MTRLAPFLMVLAAPLLLVTPSFGESGNGTQTLTIVLPNGDVEMGEKAFVRLGCSDCHAVAGRDDLPTPPPAPRGPDLGPVHAAHASADPGGMATEIVSPGHIVASSSDDPPGSTDAGVEMTDLTATMSVRDLIDLLAYLESIDDEAGGEGATEMPDG